MRTEKIYIAEDGKRFTNSLECEMYEMALDRIKELEKKRLSEEFLLSVGFDVSRYESEIETRHAINISWIVFDKFGNVKCLKTCGGSDCDFKYFSSNDMNDPDIMINWLRKNGLYAHSLISFEGRNAEFYQWNFLQKLKSLGWDVQDGKLINLNW